MPGEGPKGYFWEVHDKGGNVFWYGGLPDYVSGGTVWFNHLDGNGVPAFIEGDSSATPVPIVDTGAAVALRPAPMPTNQDSNKVVAAIAQHP